MNDIERAQWINNDAELYDWWKQTRMPMRQFLQENRYLVEAMIYLRLGKASLNDKA